MGVALPACQGRGLLDGKLAHIYCPLGYFLRKWLYRRAKRFGAYLCISPVWGSSKALARPAKEALSQSPLVLFCFYFLPARPSAGVEPPHEERSVCAHPQPLRPPTHVYSQVLFSVPSSHPITVPVVTSFSRTWQRDGKHGTLHASWIPVVWAGGDVEPPDMAGQRQGAGASFKGQVQLCIRDSCSIPSTN